MEPLLGVSAALTAHMMLSSFQLLNQLFGKKKTKTNKTTENKQNHQQKKKKKKKKREERIQIY